MNPIKQLFGQTAVYGMGVVLPRLLNYVFLTPFYTRVFDKTQYGIITELYAYVVFLLVILTYGMETGFFRFASDKNNKNKVYSSVLLSVFTTSALFLLLVIVFLHPISAATGYSGNSEYIKWLAFIVSLDAFTAIPFARIRLNNQPGKYTIIRILEVVVNIGLNWFFLYYSPRHADQGWIAKIYNPGIGVGYVFISNLAASILKLLLLSKEIFSVVKGRFEFSLLKQILKYSYPLLIAGMAGTINEALDRVLLKHLLHDSLNPMAQLGVYGANYKIAVLMTLFVQMFKYAAEPFFFGKSKLENAKTLYADILNFFVVAGLLIFLIVTIYVDYFKLFIGVEFREGVSIVPIILMANLVMGIFFNLSIWYKLTNKTLIGAFLVLTGAIITIVINVIFIPKYGYYASAWAHLICYSVMVILSYILSRKFYKIPYKFFRILGYFAIVIILYFIDLFLVKIDFFLVDFIKPALIIFAIILFYKSEIKTFKSYKELKT